MNSLSVAKHDTFVCFTWLETVFVRPESQACRGGLMEGTPVFFVTVTSANGVVSPAADQLPFGCPKEPRERREWRVRVAAVEASENSCRDLLFPGRLLMYSTFKSFKYTFNSD